MIILINTATTYVGGGVQVAKSFITECMAFKEHQFHIILGDGLKKIINKAEFPENFSFYEIGYRPATKVFSLQDQAKPFKELEAKIKPDVVFTTTGPAYWRPKAPHLMGFNLPHHVYPESPYFKKIGFYSKLRWYSKKQIIRYFTLHDADAYVVQTDDVGMRLKKWINKDLVFTITNSYGSHFDKPIENHISKLPPKAPNEIRLLFLSAYYEHKNFEIINGIAPLLEQDNTFTFKFVTTLADDVFRKIFTNQAQNSIINVGPVKPIECPGLYHDTDFVFLPTLLECFSATYVEGMKMRKPILTSDLGFAHTVCGSAASYFEAANPNDAAKKILELAKNSSLQSTLIKAGLQRLNSFLTAKQRAENYLKLCEKIFLIKQPQLNK